MLVLRKNPPIAMILTIKVHCTELHCTVLCCTALHFNSLHCTVLYWIAIYCIALCCIALQFTAVHCTAQYSACPWHYLRYCWISCSQKWRHKAGHDRGTHGEIRSRSKVKEEIYYVKLEFFSLSIYLTSIIL